jgi:hypothetical protein
MPVPDLFDKYKSILEWWRSAAFFNLPDHQITQKALEDHHPSKVFSLSDLFSQTLTIATHR